MRQLDYQIARATVDHADEKERPRWLADIHSLNRLQGNWLEDTGRRKGKAADADDLVKLNIVGGAARLQSGTGYTDGFITLDATKSPKEIELYGFNSDHWPRTIGIYRFVGDDLELSCRDNARAEPIRPTDFVATEESDFVVYRFKRQPTKPLQK